MAADDETTPGGDAPLAPEERARQVIDEATALVRLVEEVESENRAAARTALRFYAGEGQWPAAIVQARESGAVPRPCLVINEIPPYCDQVENAYKQSPPGIEVQPVDDAADPQMAQVEEGMLRAIRTASSGQAADEVAFESMVRIGWGYFRLVTDYEHDRSFDQEIRYEALPDTLSVYFDPLSTTLDGSDARQCVIQGDMPEAAFTRQYPGAQVVRSRLGDTQTVPPLTPAVVPVAEYYCLEYADETLLQLQTGQVVFASELPALGQQMGGQMPPLQVVHQRPVQRKVVKWYKLTTAEVLEERTLPGTWIPVIPMYARTLRFDNKIKRWGIVQPLQDAQTMLNYWESTNLELFALQPRAPYIGPEGFMTGHEAEWRRANDSTIMALEYATLDSAGQPILTAPTRQAPPLFDPGLIAQSDRARMYMQELSGIAQPRAQSPGSERSGASIQAEQLRSAAGTYHLPHHAHASLLHAARISMSWIPTYYSTARVVRIVGLDGKAQRVALNQGQQDLQGVQAVLHDTQAGKYDVVPRIGPDYATGQQELVASIAELAKAFPPIMQVAGSKVVRAMNIPGGEDIADKLALAEPQLPGEHLDPQKAVPQLLLQLQKTQQEAQALNVHAEQVEQAAQQLQDENATLKAQAAQKQIDLAIKQIELREAELGLLMEQEKQATARLQLEVQREQARTDRALLHRGGSNGQSDG